MKFFSPPIFESDEKKTLRAWVLNILIFTTAAALLLMVLSNYFNHTKLFLLDQTALVIFLVLVGIRWLMRMGRLRLASILWMSVVLVFITIGLLSIGTVRSASTTVLFIVIIAAGLLFDWRVVAMVTVYAILVVLLVVEAEMLGWVRPGIDTTDLSTWLSYSTFFIAVALFVVLLMNLYTQSTQRAVREIIERRKSEASLLQRDEIMRAVNLAAQRFLQAPDWQTEIEAVLAQLGQATHSSHAFLFENHLTTTGQPVSSMHYEWAAPGETSGLDDSAYQNSPLDEPDYWYAVMARGEAYYGNVENLPALEAQCLAEQGLRTIINLPIYAAGQWWGFMGFDDTEKLRIWSPVEIDALKIAAGTLGAAIERQLNDNFSRRKDLQHRLELEQRVQERTAQLEEALRELEDVSYTASHDLRAPLRAVQGFSLILLQDYSDGLGAQEQSYLQRIATEARRMGHMLDDLLRLMRLNRVALKIERFSLSDLVSATVEELCQAQPNSRLAEVHLQPGMVVDADYDLLKIAVKELLENACKFTHMRAQPEVTFGVQRQAEEQVFFIRDNGIGFDMAYAQRIFRNFEQLTAPGEVEGTGMGLALVQRIIHRHGGRVWMEAVPDEGATVYFTLPSVG